MPVEIIIPDDQIKAELEQLLNIVHNMRFYQKYWHEHFGHKARDRKNVWEQKADETLDRLGLTEHNNTRSVQVLRK